MELLFLEPIFKERIWGGSRLKTDYGYQIPSNITGEAWAISAHNHGETTIRNGKLSGTKLSEVWQNHPELFANTKTRPFPLMVKIIDASHNLSVQVHPNDQFAQMMENDSGKHECWYILNTDPDARIVYGHNAKNSQELKAMVANQEWNKLLRAIAVKKGDFFPVPTGTIHAIGAGTLILEVQQSSDITYRIYDYDRRDDKGNLRELHQDKALAVIKSPHQDKRGQFENLRVNLDSKFTVLESNEYFKVGKLIVNGELPELKLSVPYLLVSIVDGAGTVNGYSVKKGDHFIVPNQIRKLDIRGYLTMITTSET